MEKATLERTAFVAGACGSDETLRIEVLRLLVAHSNVPGFLESTALAGPRLDLAGRRLGPYALLREIGRGGMGQVYLARDTRLERSVAVKVFSGTAVQRFEREARAVASLNHPRICSLYDIGHDDGFDYLVMEHLDGETLKEKLKCGPMASAQVVRYASQIVDAIQAAHAKGIIHRDIKPANIMITATDEVKVLDFGLAKRAHAESFEALTQPGLVLGTVDYMSPEQAMGREVDARTDIFSLGIVLYEMLMGRPPFQGADVGETTAQIIHLDPPAIKGAPAELQRLISRCLEKAPAHRHQSGLELQADLLRLGRRNHLGMPAMLRSPPTKLVAAIALLTIAVTSVYWMATRSRDPNASQEGRWTSGQPPAANRVYSSIAVLPFADMSPQRDQEYFCDGLTEELINSMTKLEGVHVVARTSVFEFKGKAVDIRKIGAHLNVQTILEGSVRKTGDQLRITAQLISLPDGYHLWAETYDRDLKDVFTIQEEISRAVMEALKVKLRGGSKPPLARKQTPNLAAYNLYLLGRYYFAKRPGETYLDEAIDYFEQALQKDPNFALAYAGLAGCYTQLALWDHRPPREVMPEAKAAATRALQLDDALAEAHLSLARVKALYEYRPKEALREVEQAIALNPGYAVAHWAYAVYLESSGQSEKAMRELSQARELDPLSIGMGADMARFLFERGDTARALELSSRMLDMEPGSLRVQLSLGELLQRARRYPEAISLLEKARSGTPDYPRVLGSLGLAYGTAGRPRDARKILDRLIALRTQRYVPGYDIAIVYMGLGQRDRAVEWLEKAGEERHGWLPLWSRSHLFDDLRSNPRFSLLMKQMGWETP